MLHYQLPHLCIGFDSLLSCSNICKGPSFQSTTFSCNASSLIRTNIEDIILVSVTRDVGNHGTINLAFGGYVGLRTGLLLVLELIMKIFLKYAAHVITCSCRCAYWSVHRDGLEAVAAH